MPKPKENWRIENILTGPPTDKEWHQNGTFFNVGEDAFEKVRAKWKIQTVAQRPPRPPPVPFEELVSGLTVLTRTYELPERMTLPDIIDVFTDIWECEA